MIFFLLLAILFWVFYKRIIIILIHAYVHTRRYFTKRLLDTKINNMYCKFDGVQEIIMISSYDLSKNFYSMTKKTLQRKHDYLGRVYDIIFRECVGTKWGDIWLRMKKPLDGYFNNGTVRNYYDVLDNCIDVWVREKFELCLGEFELCLGDLELDKLTMKFLAVMVFGSVVDDDLDRLHKLAVLHNKVLPLMSEYSPIRYGFKIGFSEEIQKLEKLNIEWINFIKSMMNKSEGLVAHLALESVYRFDHKKIIHTLYEIILFNADIMTNAITHIIWDLARNQDVQTKLIDSIKNSDDSYVKKVIIESARLHPGILNTFTDLITEDLVLERKTFPSGTMFSLDTHRINTDHTIWNNPLEFNPDRYNENNIDKVYRFGLGQRKCIGRVPADIILQKVVQKIFSKYKITNLLNFSDEISDSIYKNVADGCISNIVKVHLQ